MDKKRIEEALKIYKQEVYVKNISECPCPECCAVRTIISLAQSYLNGEIAEVPSEEKVRWIIESYYGTRDQIKSAQTATTLLRAWKGEREG